MANLNGKTRFICGRNPLAENNRPSFSHAEQTSAALWLKDGHIDKARSGSEAYTGMVPENGSIQDFKLDSSKHELNAIVLEGGTTVVLNPDIHLSGPGCSDFTCKGAAVLAEENAKVDVRGG